MVSRSGFYAYLRRKGRGNPAEGVELIAQVREIYRESKGTYGSRRTAKRLQQKGYAVGRYKARTLMRQAGIAVRKKKRFKLTTDSRHGYPIAPNLLDRQFEVRQPDRVWASDITYLWTKEGWLYLAVVMDLFSRKVVGWTINKRMTSDLVKDALMMAFGRRRPGAGLIHHSDRGSQYASYDYQQLLAGYGMICSMSGKGNCWDNAVVESFFGSLKTEQTRSHIYLTREEARLDMIDYIEMFYNSRRLHSYLGYLSPNQFEREVTVT